MDKMRKGLAFIIYGARKRPGIYHLWGTENIGDIVNARRLPIPQISTHSLTLSLTFKLKNTFNLLEKHESID
jgi:hypothetical protein